MEQSEQNSRSPVIRNKNHGNSDKELIIVTGSSGLVGTNIINKLINKYQLVGLDKYGNPFPSREVEWVCFDISRAKELLDWEPEHSLMGTLPMIVEKLKENTLKWYQKSNLKIPSELEKKKQ